MYCPYCGLRLEEDATLCPGCGESQIFEEDPEEAPEGEVPQVGDAAVRDALPVPFPAEPAAAAPAVPGKTRTPRPKPAARPSRGGKRVAPSGGLTLFSGAGPRSASRKELKPAPTGKKDERQEPSLFRLLMELMRHVRRSLGGLLRLGVRRLVIASLCVILAAVLIAVIVGGVSSRNTRRVLAVVSEDLVLLQGEESLPLEMNYLADSVAADQGGKTAAALTQLANAAVSRKGVVGYLDDYVVLTDSWTLKLHELRRPEVEHQIDTGVYSEMLPGVCGNAGELTAEWKMSEDGSTVFYLKDKVDYGADLYRYSGGSARKVASRVFAFDISADGKRVLWVSSDENGVPNVLSVQDFSEKGGGVQLDTEYSRLAGYDSRFDAVFYTRDGGDGVNPIALYAAGFAHAKERLVPGLSYVTKIGADGSFFYIAADASSGKNLFYHTAAGENQLVTRSCNDVSFCDPARGLAVYCSESVSARNYYLYAEGVTLDFQSRWVVDAAENKKGTELYLILFAEGEGRGLYRCKLSQGQVSQPVQLAESCSELLYDEESDTLFYAVHGAEVNRSSLFAWDGKTSHLLSDHAYPLVASGGKNRWAFFTEVDVDRYSSSAPQLLTGKLNLYSGGNVSVVDENVSLLFWRFEEDGALLYIKDYYDAFGGSLFLSKGEKTTRLSSDAQAVLTEERFLRAFGR